MKNNKQQFKQFDMLALDIMAGDVKFGTEYYIFYRYRNDEYFENTFDAIAMIPFTHSSEDKEKEIFFGISNHVLNNQLRLCNEDEIKMIKRLLENEYLWLSTNYNICYGIRENI